MEFSILVIFFMFSSFLLLVCWGFLVVVLCSVLLWSNKIYHYKKKWQPIPWRWNQCGRFQRPFLHLPWLLALFFIHVVNRKILDFFGFQCVWNMTFMSCGCYFIRGDYGVFCFLFCLFNVNFYIFCMGSSTCVSIKFWDLPSGDFEVWMRDRWTLYSTQRA